LVGTVENVAKAKAELIDALPPGGIAIVPEEPLLEPYLRADVDVRRFGTVETFGRYRVGRREISLETSYRAPHQLQNTLAALTVCDALGLPLPDGGRLEVAFSPLREEVVELEGGITLINDCYNANPASMRAALAHLAELAGDRRRVAVLGEMAELGAGAAGFHREVGEEIARMGVEVLVAVGPLAAGYVSPAVESHVVSDADGAAGALAGALRPGDVVLIKGSRAVGLEAVAAKLQG
ncbi:MAG TPA: cyanophycin synthetase, partial [Solirubrobacterales bacterium]